MRDIPSEIANQLALRQGIVVRNLFWVKGKSRVTGDVEEIGFWNGADHRDFVIDGEIRTYYGAGALINFGQLTAETGLVIRKYNAKTAPMAPEVQKAFREYQARFAAVEQHCAFYDPETMNLVADPYRVFKGWIDTISFKTPSLNDEATLDITMVSNARILTRMVPTKRSNESQKLRNPADAFFADVAVSGIVNTVWGPE